MHIFRSHQDTPPAGTFSAPAPLAILLLLMQWLSTANAQEWCLLGPGGMPASLGLSRGQILCGTDWADIARSTDGGAHWAFTSQGLAPRAGGVLPKNSISCLVTDPLCPDTVYAGEGIDETTTGQGFFASTDGGTTWQARNAGLPSWPAIPEIAVNPHDPSEIFVFCRHSSNPGVYRSSNRGSSWELWLQGNYTSTVLFHGADSTLRYVIERSGTVHRWHSGVHEVIPSTTPFTYRVKRSLVSPQTGSLFCMHPEGVFRWRGDSVWTSLLPAINTLVGTVGALFGLAVDPVTSTLLVSTDRGVILSRDDGDHWELAGAWRARVAARTGLMAAVGMSGTYTSTDAGHTWIRTGGSPPVGAIPYATRVFTPGGHRIYALCGNDVIASDDEGTTWVAKPIPPGSSGTVLVVNPLSAQTLYLGSGNYNLYGLGLFISHDAGGHWERVIADTTIPVTAVDVSRLDTARIVVGAPGRALESIDAGRNWHGLISFAGSTQLETSVVRLSWLNPARVYVGVTSNHTEDAGFFATSDSGYHWERQIDGMTEALDYTCVTAITPDPTTDSIIYIGNGIGVFRSTNGGRSWKEGGLKLPIGTANVSEIALAPDDPRHLFAAVLSYRDGYGGLFHSTDAGENWMELITPGLVNRSRSSVSVSIADAHYRLIIGSEAYGIITVDMPLCALSARDQASRPVAVLLEQNFPNPFNPSTTIRYGLPSRSHVTLTVFNTLGQQVVQLVDGEIDAGYHDVKFDGSGLASGVYLYRIQAGSYVDTKGLLLVR